MHHVITRTSAAGTKWTQPRAGVVSLMVAQMVTWSVSCRREDAHLRGGVDVPLLSAQSECLPHRSDSRGVGKGKTENHFVSAGLVCVLALRDRSSRQVRAGSAVRHGW